MEATGRIISYGVAAPTEEMVTGSPPVEHCLRIGLQLNTTSGQEGQVVEVILPILPREAEVDFYQTQSVDTTELAAQWHPSIFPVGNGPKARRTLHYADLWATMANVACSKATTTGRPCSSYMNRCSNA